MAFTWMKNWGSDSLVSQVADFIEVKLLPVQVAFYIISNRSASIKVVFCTEEKNFFYSDVWFPHHLIIPYSNGSIFDYSRNVLFFNKSGRFALISIIFIVFIMSTVIVSTIDYCYFWVWYWRSLCVINYYVEKSLELNFL